MDTAVHDAKVTMFDKDGNRLGKTFRRRAVQLVKNQRAQWKDDDHSAICFIGELTEAVPIECDDDTQSLDEGKETAALYAMARERLRARKLFLWHSVSFLPVLTFLVVWIYEVNIWRQVTPFALMGAWCTAYVIHLWQYASKRLKGFNSAERAMRHAQKIRNEVEMLKRISRK